MLKAFENIFNLSNMSKKKKSNKHIYKKVKLVILVEGDPKTSFSSTLPYTSV